VNVKDWAAVIRKKSPTSGPAAPQGLVMYSTSWCGVCKRARSYFAAKGIRYTEIDVEQSEAGRRQYDALGVRGVPAIVLGGKVMSGFSEEGLQALLAKS
jgi:glutaredoxin